MNTVLLVADIIVAVLLMGSILLQTGYTPGMSGALGGGYTQQGLGGKKQGVDEFLAKVTVVLSILFAVITLLLARFWH
ncbi:preprotein translocase subunit SecG [Methylacidiphilum caldifontis]|uniref:Protein-export membrane protein SecG n=2 Tax=Bacteria TaxID=2 RepID=G8U0N4_SULAD|nr:preprotein translocase subunit SecG [Methylacidiphilum caldifontis]AEJ39704.1 hypothetical protein TPY_1520 [Sulfobacillus acidophilus TPY]AEW04256.1 preprotein translocase, SecG subunit [Sulfobacillus acidophilus DSM 10332]TFE65479.1 preprotein translocase subunit SecG [Methylacidiphilum caldifontis]